MSLNSVLGSEQSQTDLLVESFKSTQQGKITSLNERRNLLQSRQSFYNTFNSRISSLVSQIDKFTADDSNSKFYAKSIESSDSSIVSASANSKAIISENTIKVKQLASNDTLISKRMNLADNFGEDAGTITFDLTAGTNTKQVSVTFDGTETNEQALKKIVQAINNTDDIDINSSYVKDTSISGRISLRAKNTGTDNRITFNDNPILAKLGLVNDDLLANTNTRVLASDSGAGFRIADYEDLNSKIELNGINITRSSNNIDDALEGVTLNILKVQSEADDEIKLNTGYNVKSVEEFVKGLLTAYNDVISNINNNKDIKRNDSAVSGLLQNLRNVPLTKFNEDPEVGFSYLVDVGITFDKSGFLVISDNEKFKKALESNPQKLAELFTAENGFARRTESLIEPFKGSAGLLTVRNNNLKTQIELTNKRIAETENRIEIQAESMRKQYNSYLKLFYDAQNQSTLLNGFMAPDNTGLM